MTKTVKGGFDFFAFVIYSLVAMKPLNQINKELCPLIAILVLAGAYGFEFLGYEPCDLCLKGRYAWWGIIALSPLLWLASPKIRHATYLLMIALLLANFALSLYHAGIEWHWWSGDLLCRNISGDGLAFDEVFDSVIACDEAAWRALGLSLAGYNGLISLSMVAVILWIDKKHDR